MIYFITQQDRFVKIGYTEADAYARLASLQTGNPYPLQILKVTHGSQQDEHHIHIKFSHISIIGEWFYLTKQMRSYIESLPVCQDIQGDMRQASNELDALRDQHQSKTNSINKVELFNLLDKLVDRFGS